MTCLNNFFDADFGQISLIFGADFGNYDIKSTVIREALHLLTLAGLVVPVVHSNANRCFDSSGRRHIPLLPHCKLSGLFLLF